MGVGAIWRLDMANVITTCRILISIIILFIPALSPEFYVLYLLAGFTDAIDGAVARKMNTVSEFGSTLDTIADFIFVVICFIKIVPLIHVPKWIWIWIGVIAVIKIINVVSGVICQKRLVAIHSVMNKAVGLLVFVLPFTFSVIELKYSAPVICFVAMFAAIQEGHFIRIGRDI